MHYNIKNGSSTLLTVLLMIILIAVAAFGFLIFVSKWDERVAFLQTDPVNLTGINYTSETFNATNSTIHGLAQTMPNFIWIVIIFFLVIFVTLLAVGLRQR